MMQNTELRPSCVADQFSDFRIQELFSRLVKNPNIHLSELLLDRQPGEIRLFVELYLDRRSRPRFFEWNFDWHCNRVRELSEIRDKFHQSLGYVLDQCCFDG